MGETWTDGSGRTRLITELEDDHLLYIQRWLGDKDPSHKKLRAIQNEMVERGLIPLPGKAELPKGFAVSVGKNLVVDLSYDSDSKVGTPILEIEGRTIKKMFIGGIGDCFLHLDFLDGTYVHLGVNDIGWWNDAENCKHVKHVV